MKNKHLLLLMVFGLSGLWFFQKWPFHRQNHLELPFLEVKPTAIRSFSFSKIETEETFELRKASQWMLTANGQTHTAVDSCAAKFLAQLSILQQGKMVDVPNAQKAGELYYEKIDGQRLRREIYRDSLGRFLVRAFDAKPHTFMLYDAHSVLTDIMAFRAESFRNTAILGFEPTEVTRFSYQRDSTTALFFEKKKAVDSTFFWETPRTDSCDVDGFLGSVSGLNGLPFVDDFETEIEPVLQKVRCSFVGPNGIQAITFYQRKDSSFCLVSSANPMECFGVGDSLAMSLWRFRCGCFN